MTQKQAMDEPPTLALEEGVFELGGPEPTWIWVDTCPTPGCSCRDAFVLATSAGRDALLKRAATAHEKLRLGASRVDVASGLHGVDTFLLDIDLVVALSPEGEFLELEDHPRVRAVVEGLDGDVLDAIGRLWYRGKGWPDPEFQVREAKEIVIPGWRPGDMLAYDDVLTGLREDMCSFDDGLFEAVDLHCIKPGCACGEVFVGVEAHETRTNQRVGHVVVEPSGALRMEPKKGAEDRLEQVWAAFVKRHPRYRERFARRGAVLKELGSRVLPGQAVAAKAQPKVGRNDPCPCGSGKKHKKCCGAK
jgi:hypothetical protein